MSNFNVILFTDIVCDSSNIQVNIPAIGAYKLANTLRACGYSCLVVNHVSEFTIDEIYALLNCAVGTDTYMIGFSTTFYDLITSVVTGPTAGSNSNILGQNFNLFPQGADFGDQVFAHINKLNAAIKIAVGGPMIRSELQCKYADFLVLGYAEANIVNLVDHIKHGVALKNSYKNINNNKIIINNVLAEGYEFSKDTMTWRAEDVVNHTRLPIEIGRGCVFSCAFCSYPMNGKTKLDFIKDAATLKQELLHNYNNHGICIYMIVDDTFNDSVEKLVQLRDMIVSLPFKPEFWCYARLDLICTHPETIHMLYDIGVRSLFFGIETLDRKSGQAVGKGYNREKQIAMISTIKETYHDMVLHGSFIVGTPYETIESAERTLKALTAQEIKLDSCSFRPLIIGKKTNGAVFESSITKDYAKFGYREMPNVSHHNMIMWENDQMNFFQANQLVEKYSITNSLRDQQFTYFLEPEPPHEFLLEYKRKLLELVTDEKQFAQH